MKKFSVPLPCPLDDHEVKDLSLKLIEALENGENLKAEAKLHADSFKDRMAGQKAEADRLREAIKTQSREKDVECAEITMHDVGDVVTLRLDTGAEVKRRRITDEEKQGSLLAEPVEGEEEETRIVGLFGLADMLTGAGMTLGRNLQPLWRLGTDKIAEARDWVTAHQAATEEEKPTPPEWLKDLEAESQKEVAQEHDFQIRVNTIKAVLQEQGVKMDETQIGELSVQQQDEILAWSDSQGKEHPMERPEFLAKYVDPDAKLEVAQDGAVTVVHQLALAETGPDTHESRPVCDPSLTEFAIDTNAPVNCPACLAKTASNGHLDLTTEDLALRINGLGVEVTVDKVGTWTEDERHSAEGWIVETETAIAASEERKPAPEFFFREG